MSGMFYQPWVGADYRAARDYRMAIARDLSARVAMGSGLPIHVLGESHYGTADEHDPDNTQRIVRACAFEPSSCSKVFTTVANVVATALDEQKPFDFRKWMWERLAFSNYVQDLLPHSRKEPSAEEWRRGAEAFMDQLRLTVPPILFVLGWRLWDHLPAAGAIEMSPIEAIGEGSSGVPESRVYVYLADGIACATLAIPVAHPSSGGHFWRCDPIGRLRTALLTHGGILTTRVVLQRMDELLAADAGPVAALT